MDWVLDKKRPICPQLMERLSMLIMSGEIKAGERVLSVRDVALKAGVTPNTVQKSYEQLEQKGIIYSKRGSGWYVCDDTSSAHTMISELVKERTDEYIGGMRSMGLSDEEIFETVKEELGYE